MNTGFSSIVLVSQRRSVVLDCISLAVGLFILSACQANGTLIKPQVTTISPTLTQDKPATSSLSAETPSGFCPNNSTFATGFAPAQANETLVVVSNFTDPQGNDPHNLAQDLVDRMHKMLASYANIRVEHLQCAIDPQDGNATALRIANREDMQATIMIWGVYVTPADPVVRVYFNIVKEKSGYLGASFNRRFGPHVLQPSGFDIEADLSTQMNTMVIFSTGLLLVNASEYPAAEPLFATTIDDGNFARLIQFYRGVNDLYLGRLLDAKHELELLQPAQTVTAKALDLPLLDALGLAYSASGRQQKALECYDQTLPLYQALSDKAGEAKSLNSIAVIYTALGDYQKAYQVYNQALALYQSISDKAGEARVLTNLGDAHGSVHEYRQANEYYDLALRLAQSAGDKAGEARVRDTIGYQLRDTDEEQNALEYFNQALALYQSIGDKAGEAEVRTDNALVYYSLGEKQRALEFFKQVLALYQSLGDKVGEASALINIGDFYTAQDQEQKTQEYYNQAVALYQSLGDKAGEARLLARLGDSQLSSLDQQKALDYYNQALLLYQAAGNTAGEARIYNKIGGVYRYTFFEEQKALEYYQRALPLYQEEGNKDGEATTLYNIADFYDFMHDPEQALDAMLKARDIFHSTADRWSEVVVRSQSAEMQAQLNELNAAAESLEIAIDLANEIDHPILPRLHQSLDEINAKRNE